MNPCLYPFCSREAHRADRPARDIETPAGEWNPAGPARFRCSGCSLRGVGRRCDSRWSREPIAKTSVLRLRYSKGKEPLRQYRSTGRWWAETTDLTLEVDGRRAHQITVVICLLQRRHGLRAHHSRNRSSYGTMQSGEVQSQPATPPCVRPAGKSELRQRKAEEAGGENRNRLGGGEGVSWNLELDRGWLRIQQVGWSRSKTASRHFFPLVTSLC